MRLCVALLVLPWGWPLQSRAQAATIDAEYQVKAAFLYKFLSFVEWPATAFQAADSPIVIGVLGAEPLAQELSRVVVARTINERTVSVRRFAVGDPVTGLHVLFVGRSQSARLAPVMTAASGHAVLTISEADDGPAPGSMINFVVADDKVRFDVVLYRAERAGLRISARLLSVARRVWQSPS